MGLGAVSDGQKTLVGTPMATKVVTKGNIYSLVQRTPELRLVFPKYMDIRRIKAKTQEVLKDHETSLDIEINKNVLCIVESTQADPIFPMNSRVKNASVLAVICADGSALSISLSFVTRKEDK
ncbi:hypothetical protein BLNAU_2984 [Blattamonas nauphoetae]|uniref:Uncharacterized protein n=1 Tax=Blattamonas nauphoetae TaxID=2049346 RepID=A0ABQ9YE17_9EUKA|nr:hypothetical protein BLNAU_2984 [Blattamonas nauphoetae]